MGEALVLMVTYDDPHKVLKRKSTTCDFKDDSICGNVLGQPNHPFEKCAESSQSIVVKAYVKHRLLTDLRLFSLNFCHTVGLIENAPIIHFEIRCFQRIRKS